MEYSGSLLGRSAIEITELAVDADYEGKGFGRQLINVALLITDDVRKAYIGVEHLVACVDPMAEQFYLHMEFQRLADYYDIQREGWNRDCVPMVLRLPDI